MSTYSNTTGKQNAGGTDERSGSVMRRLLFGQIVSSDLFARNWLALILGVFMILAYISGKYSCQTKMEEVTRLSKEYAIKIIIAIS